MFVGTVSLEAIRRSNAFALCEEASGVSCSHSGRASFWRWMLAHSNGDEACGELGK